LANLGLQRLDFGFLIFTMLNPAIKQARHVFFELISPGLDLIDVNIIFAGELFFSSFKAAKATLALKLGEWFLLFLRISVSLLVDENLTENTLIALSYFWGPLLGFPCAIRNYSPLPGW
jgi:hypothetical protein